MWGGYAWGQSAWSSQQQFGSVPPVPDVGGIVFGGDATGFRVYGGDASSADGIVVGGDSDSHVVFGGDA